MLDGGEVGGRVVGADAAVVISEDHVHDPVQAVFDRPVRADEGAYDMGEQDERGDEEPRLRLDLAVDIASVTTHGVRCLAERRQAPIVPSTVLNVLAPEVMRAVATTVRTAASPLADHMAR